MTRKSYVDLDLYGRGFDGIFGYGAEQENRHQALMKFKAMRRFKERVKPGEYIDLDLYGRGDPRVFGPEAHIHTQKHAQKLMDDVQQRKRDGHVNHGIIMFPVGLKAITRKARMLMKRASSKSSESSERQSPADENMKNDLEGSTEDRAVPFGGETQEEKENVEEPKVSGDAPIRVKSKLPSEEVPPYVEPGVVARTVKSISSQDRIEDENIIESGRNTQVIEPVRIGGHASNVSRGVFPPKESDSGPARSAGSSGAREKEAASAVDQTRRLAEPVSTTSEVEVAKGILVGSDEEFPLSFSTNVRDGGRNRNDYESTSSEEDLLARQPNQERVLVDAAGRNGSAGNKIAGLFRSGDSDSGSGQEDKSERSRQAGPSRMDDTYSSTDDETVSTEEAGEVMEISPNNTALVEGDSNKETRQVAEVEDVQPVMGTREASIVKVVETGDVFIDHELEVDSNNNLREMMDVRAARNTTTGTGAAQVTAAGTTIRDADEEAANVIGQAAEDQSSSDGSGSSGSVDFDDQGDASMDSDENIDGSAYVTDSDRSGEAGSSSVVMSSSPEEDSDDIEIETSGEVLDDESEEAEEVEEEETEEKEEKSTEEVGLEETEDYGEVRVVNSSEARMTSPEDNDAAEGSEADNAENENDGDAEDENPHGEDGEATSFWQRLNFFGTIVQGSWTVY